jgi:hypothetical protein
MRAESTHIVTWVGKQRFTVAATIIHDKQRCQSDGLIYRQLLTAIRTSGKQALGWKRRKPHED